MRTEQLCKPQIPLTLGSERSFTSGTTQRLGHAGGGPALASALHSTDARLGAVSACLATARLVETDELLSPSMMFRNCERTVLTSLIWLVMAKAVALKMEMDRRRQTFSSLQ